MKVVVVDKEGNWNAGNIKRVCFVGWKVTAGMVVVIVRQKISHDRECIKL